MINRYYMVVDITGELVSNGSCKLSLGPSHWHSTMCSVDLDLYILTLLTKTKPRKKENFTLLIQRSSTTTYNDLLKSQVLITILTRKL
jgi:hypothetical protein